LNKSLKKLIIIPFASLLASCYIPVDEFLSYLDVTTTSLTTNTALYDGPIDQFYSSIATWENGTDLKNKLNALMRSTYTPIKYAGPNWESNQKADRALDDFEAVDVVYSPNNLNACQTYLSSYASSTGWQREHAFCASLMCGSSTGNAVTYLGRATDFHNLFAAYPQGNMARGNKNYGVADKTSKSYTDCTVDNGNDGYSYDSTTFEPGNKDKGRAARAIFYMATMYNVTDKDTSNNVDMKALSIKEEHVEYVSGNSCAFATGHLSELLSWNTNFPVDRLEYQHNQSVYADTISAAKGRQGNRNPFVDYPALVDYVFGAKKDISGKLSDLHPSKVLLDIDSTEFSNYAIETAIRTYHVGETFTSNDYSVVAVKKNFTYEAISKVTDSTQYKFTSSDKGFKTMKAKTPDGEISYLVKVVD